MTFSSRLAGLTLAATLSAGAASATSVSITTFDIGEYNSATSFAGSAQFQDFELITATEGILAGPLNTNVGTFSAITNGGTQVGSGTTCQASLGNPAPAGTCSELALFDGPINGQGNLVPTNGTWSLNSNDTLGIHWDVFTGSMFNRIVFGMTDAGDQGAIVQIIAEGLAAPVNFLLGNANRKLVVVDFDTLLPGATVKILSSKVNDAVAIDGAAVGVVPLPAAGFLLLGGVGALAAMRRRKQSAT